MSAAPDPAATFAERVNELLALLADPQADAAAIERKARELASVFDSLCAAGQDAAQPDSLARAAQLSAVAREAVARRLDRVAGQLQAVRNARKDLDSTDGTLGSSCDAEG